MSYTVTLTQQRTDQSFSPEILVLREDNLSSAFHLLNNLNIFTPEEIQKIEEIRNEISNLKDSNDIATSLCFLLYYIIHPKIHLIRNENIIRQLLNIEDKIKLQLKSYLAEELDIEEYVLEKFNELQSIEKLVHLEANLSKLIERFRVCLEVEREEAINVFNQIKMEIQRIYSNLKNASKECDVRLEKLNNRLNDLVEELNQTVSSAKQVGEMFQNQQKSLNQIVSKGL